MSLKDLKGHTVKINFDPTPNISVSEIANELEEVTRKKRLSLRNESHRLFLGKWIREKIEVGIGDFIERLQIGDPALPSSERPGLTPQQLRRENTRGVATIIDGEVVVYDH